jgi:hypothetical protein
MDRIREIASRGHWEGGVFDAPPRIGARLIRVKGQFPTEAEAVAASQAVIDEGRPNISTFIDKKTAKPSVSYVLSRADIDEIGRELGRTPAPRLETT